MPRKTYAYRLDEDMMERVRRRAVDEHKHIQDILTEIIMAGLEDGTERKNQTLDAHLSHMVPRLDHGDKEAYIREHVLDHSGRPLPNASEVFRHIQEWNRTLGRVALERERMESGI